MATLGEQPFSGEPGREPPIGEPGVSGDGPLRERSVGALLGDLIGETSALMKAEVTLARQEMQHNLHTAQRGAASMATGAAVLSAGLLALVACAILVLNYVMADWVAALLVGLVVSGIGAAMLMIGKRKALGEGIKPQRTLHSLREVKDMARQETERAVRRWR
jgi:hypothetical protein